VIRRLFHGASAMSLLLCVVAVVLWARSFRVQDVVVWQEADHVFVRSPVCAIAGWATSVAALSRAIRNIFIFPQTISCGERP
jgi:hypothetical protein